MRKIIILPLVLILTACSGSQPVVQEPLPTPIVQTVVVIATTQVSPPTEAPSATPAPTNTEAPQPTPIPPTVVQPTVEANSDLTQVFVDNILGKGVFADIVFSSDRLTLNCYPRDMTITMRAIHPDVTRAEMFYRMVEVPEYFRYSDWYLIGNMDSDGAGNFSITLSGTDLSPDWRSMEKAVIEFQFAGVNKGGGVVDRTQKIEKMVTYYKECP
ncbi:MAG: hypothetical protein H6635_10320 [Anaerolineales bacterium]|nr:hypothetical protein [Anaerolineales bacterium]